MRTRRSFDARTGRAAAAALRGRRAAAVLLVLSGGNALGCGSPPGTSDADTVQAADTARAADTVTARPIEEVLADQTDAWMEIEGVEGTGIGLCDGSPCIKIFVSRPPEELADLLPRRVEGHAVRLEPTGRFRKR